MITELEFQSLARAGYHRIPLVTEAFADLETPLSLYLKLAHAHGDGTNSFLLESVEGGERFGRYSFIGLPARTLLRASGFGAEATTEVVTDGQVVETHHGNPLDFIAAYQQRLKVALVPGLPRFCGGLAGYFGYDAVRYIEPKLEKTCPPDGLDCPDILLLQCEELAVIDNLSGKLYFIVYADPSRAESYSRAKKRMRELKELLRYSVSVPQIKGGAISNAIQEQNEREALVASVTAYDDKYVPNVYVDGIHLGGMTRAEAEEAVTAHANQQRDAWKVRLMYAGQLVREITSADLNMTVDVQEALDAAWQPGHTEGGIDARKATMDALAENPYEGYSATPSGDNVVIDNILLSIAQQAYIQPVDAHIIFDSNNFNNPLTIQPETVGRYMDTTEAKNQVYQMMSSLVSGEVELTTRELQPTTTKAMLEPQIQLRATAYTPISTTSTEERNLNIQVAFERINGKMLAAGETFSFNTIVGKRTKANGFYQAIEYAYGDQRMGYGGGVCQASTTMYLAAAKANMTILKREPHSDAVGYTDYGKDATVSDNRIDFKFRNDTNSTIFIVATVMKDSRYDKSHKVCVVSIYGESLGKGVKYELETVTVQTLPAPTEPEYRKDTNHTYATYVDQEYTYRKATDGCVVESYLVKYVGGAETERKLMYTDTYKAKSEIIYVGTVERTEEGQ